MSIRLYIGNLPKEEIDRQELQAIFAEEGDAVTTKLIKDRKTGKCRGFGFLTVNNDDQADKIIEKYNGQLFKENPIKLEKALPRTKGDEGEEQAQPQPQVAKPVTQSSGGGSVATGGAKEGGRREKSKKSRRGGGGSRETATHTDNEAIRPDPRWAAELEKLREMLAAQATN
ncbi:RNA-binding protein [Anabaena sp. FACHB-1237]|uniref:RNA recognition motif domain-containing protein n=1 Tax=Anabaena sp. FACHB-1237 TaxID=2692769 RepID=UPI001680ADF6|nr:RNA-binding protein [Anabaena sp. FACHB-1237]MBD2138229.1 RNA-binding protein [Anabaena sp. FACHB-1237]